MFLVFSSFLYFSFFCCPDIHSSLFSFLSWFFSLLFFIYPDFFSLLVFFSFINSWFTFFLPIIIFLAWSLSNICCGDFLFLGYIFPEFDCFLVLTFLPDYHLPGFICCGEFLFILPDFTLLFDLEVYILPDFTFLFDLEFYILPDFTFLFDLEIYFSSWFYFSVWSWSLYSSGFNFSVWSWSLFSSWFYFSVWS